MASSPLNVTLLPEKNLSRHGRPHSAASLTGVAVTRANEKALQPDADAARCGKELWSAFQDQSTTQHSDPGFMFVVICIFVCLLGSCAFFTFELFSLQTY